MRYEKPLKIYVIGEVNKPGYYTFHKSLKNENPDLKISSFGLPTVLDGIQQAGGITSESNIKEIKLYRKLPGELKQVKFTTLDLSKILTEGDLSQNPLLMNEDVISISKAKKNDINDNSEIVNSNLYPDKISITVIGSVVNPGVFRLASNSNLSTAIYTAGGLRPFKGKNNVELLRIQRNGKTINKKYKLSNMESLRGKNPILKDGDIVKVNDTNYAKLTQGLGLITEPLSQLVTTYSFIKLLH